MSAFALLAVNLLEAALPLMRAIFLARLLPQEDFGIAVTILATVTIVEVCCDFGLPQVAVRGSMRTPSIRFLDTIHSINLCRSLIMILVTIPILWFLDRMAGFAYGTEIFYLIGATLFLRGFENLSQKKLMRSYNFWREAILAGGFQIVWTIVSIATALVTPSYHSMLYGMLAAAAWTAIVSNLVAPEAWRPSWDHNAASEAVKFGAPMVPNGIVSAIGNTDRIMIASYLGAQQVAIYSVAISFITVPLAIIWRLSGTALAAFFIDSQTAKSDFSKKYRIWLYAAATLFGLYAFSVWLLGIPFIQLTFGEKYQPSSVLVTLIAISAFIQLMMCIPLAPAFALGETKVILLGSILWTCCQVIAIFWLTIGGNNIESFMIVLNMSSFAALILFLSVASAKYSRRPSLTLISIPVFMFLIFWVCLPDPRPSVTLEAGRASQMPKR